MNVAAPNAEVPVVAVIAPLKVVEARETRPPDCVSVESKVTAPVDDTFPGKETVWPVLPIVIPVEVVVPMRRVPVACESMPLPGTKRILLEELTMPPRESRPLPRVMGPLLVVWSKSVLPEPRSMVVGAAPVMAVKEESPVMLVLLKVMAAIAMNAPERKIPITT